MKCKVRGPRSRWVGPPVSAPKSELSRSPSGRQKHYGAVELAGAGDQVNVNDVVEVAESKQEVQESSQRHPVLVQVLSMWEDTFTGVFKFRARWLVQASDLPADALSRLRTTRQPAAADDNVTGSTTPLGQDQDGADEVFLTKRVKDLEVRSIAKPITLHVSTSGTTEVSPERKHKMGPRLTHSFCDVSGEFRPLEGTDPILKRARVRQANAIALASRADQEHEAAKSGKPVVKSNGWLLPKRGAFERRGGRTAARGSGGGVEIVALSSNSTGSHQSSTAPSVDIEEPSDDSAPDEPPPSEDDEWKEGEDENATDSDSDSPRNSQPTFSVDEGFTQRKSARQRKSQLSPTPDADPDADPETDSDAKVVEECPVGTCVDKPCPAPSISGPTFQRRRRAPSNKRQGPLPPRPRRLAMPPMVEEPPIAHVCDASPHANAKASVAIKVVRPVRTRMSLGLRPKPSLALPRSASMEDVGKASPQVSVSAKRKRSVANKATQGGNRSDYPPLRTLVGKDYQTDIPDLLSADERNQPHTGAGAKMVWRSVQDWDPQSRGMLASYLHAAKEVVEAKQARPGVAVHVRLGGKKDSSGVDNESTGIANSYAVWAISSGREACGLVRVACSEMAQTDIPRSAIQRVQSQEQALSALVKARCVLDNFEPALEMLAGDHGSPESIETWTLKQVRTLEKALVEEYDPNRRLHGWARPGMEMDREDFIDLAKVSQEVPGKTPSQVLSFYYRYLAAAEPLTDVVYGPEAAKARKQEPICPVSSAHEADVPSNGRPTRGDANTTNPKVPARQVSPGLSKASTTNSSGNAIESALKPKPRIIRLSAPKPADPVVVYTKPNDGATIDSVPNDDASTRRVPSLPACDAGFPAREATSTPHSPAMSKHTTDEVTPGGDEFLATADRVTGRELTEGDRVTGRAVDSQGGGGGGLDGASEYLAQQRRCAVRDREVTRALPPLPPDAEVLEVEDSDDADGAGASRNSAVSAPGGGEPVRPSDVEAAARHITTMGPAGLSWVARQIRRQATPAVAPESQPSAVLPMAPRAVSRNSDVMERQRAGGSDCARYGYRSSPEKEPRWEHPAPSQSISHEEHGRCYDDRRSGSQFERDDISSGGFNDPGYGGRRNVHVGSEPPSRDDMFGSMAPCWRLLERAKGYMDKDQLEYMKGLILTHVRKPMSRDQLLERAESCLQEQDKIFAAFVKMFDHIDQPPQVPLYPTKRALHPRSQWAPYSVGRSLDVDPNHASPHGFPPPNIPPSRSFESQRGGPYSLHSTNDGGDPARNPSQSYPCVGMPVGGRVEIRRSIHPYDHNGAGGWQASEVGSTASDDAVGSRAPLPPRRLSPGPHPSELGVHPAGYPESHPDTGNVGRARVRKTWPQPPGEWNTYRGSSAAAAAAASAVPSGIIWRGSRGPAWGGGGGGAWN